MAVEPGRPGENTIAVELRDPAGAPVEAADLSMELANPAAGVEPLARRLQRLGPGRDRLVGGELAFAGEWTIDLRARISDFDGCARLSAGPARNAIPRDPVFSQLVPDDLRTSGAPPTNRTRSTATTTSSM